MKITRLLMILALTLTWPVAASAVSVLMPTDNQYPPLSIKSNLVDVRVDGPVARTHIYQVFHNPHPRDLEGTFVISLPKDAQVTDFVMTINGEEVHAQALESGEAREIYTSIVRRMKDPGLLEFVDHQTFRVRVFPIPGDGDMPIELSYAQPLRREGDMYALDFGSEMAAGARQVDESAFSATINWDSRLGTIYSPTHQIDIERSETGHRADVDVLDFHPEEGRDLTILFAPEEEGVGIHVVTNRPDEDEPGTFLLMIHPPTVGALAQPVPKLVTFVLDVSGSMNQQGKIDKAKAALIQCLGALGPEDKFRILTFESGVDSYPRHPAAATRENIDDAVDYIDKIRASGGTNFHQAMMDALGEKDVDGLHQIVVLTDGLPTVGVTTPDQIMRAIKSHNSNGLRIFTLGVGYDVNTHLLDRVAEETRALSTYVKPKEDLEVKVSTFFDSVAYPVLTNLQLTIDHVGAYDVYPLELPDLFKGQDLTVFGRYREGDKARIQLTGMAGDNGYEIERKTEFPDETGDETAYIEDLWANRKVGYLLDQIRLHGENPELKEAVIELAKEHNLVTPYTSFLVADDSEFAERPPALVMQHRISGMAPARRTLPAAPAGSPAQGGRGGGPLVADHPTVFMTDKMTNDTFEFSTDTTTNLFRFSDAFVLDSYVSGEGAVELSEMLNEKKQAESLGQVAAADKKATVRQIAGKTFVFNGKQWIQQDIPEDAKELKVEYLSDAYFELLKKFPKMKAALVLGEQVTLHLGGRKVVIGEAGISKVDDLPKELKR
ncbi:VIT and VWA domain-containing protein [bacterium]|nr:VIT and VWA domain-containing protein [bacterium]